MVKMKDAKLVNKEILVSRFKKVVQEKLQLDNGEVLDWIYLDSPKSIVVVALTPEKEIVLVNLYRHNLRKDVTELPAGNTEANETDIDAAKRELLEETGYSSEHIVPLGSFYVLPSETNRDTHYFLALDAKKVQQPKLDDLIEKYWDMSVTSVPFKSVIATSDAATRRITGVESLFGIRLADEYMRSQNKI